MSTLSGLVYCKLVLCTTELRSDFVTEVVANRAATFADKIYVIIGFVDGVNACSSICRSVGARIAGIPDVGCICRD